MLHRGTFVAVLFALILPCLAMAATLPDTGQTSCYDLAGNIIACPQKGDALYGQDGNYTGQQPSYQRNDQIVTDLVTGLTWQQADAWAMDWDNANTKCQDLNLGGQSDWRLPSLKELLSTIDSGRAAPSINPTFSCASPASEYWSATTYAGNSNEAWFVHIIEGAATFENKSKARGVRCVRGSQIQTPDYHVNGNIINDQTTGISWERNVSSSTKSWSQALDWCESATTGGYSDWRLPNIRELANLVDDLRKYPAIDPDFILSDEWNYTNNHEIYWSSTTNTYIPTSAWTVDFNVGQIYSGYNKKNTVYVRCVRDGLADDAVTTLTSGVTVANLTGVSNSVRRFKIAVPAGTTILRIQYDGPVQSCHLLAKAGSSPVLGDDDVLMALGDSLDIAAPQAGDWYITLTASEPYSGMSITATLLTPNFTELGVPDKRSSLSGDEWSKKYFRITVPAGIARLGIATSGGSGDCDLYLGTKPGFSTDEALQYSGGMFTTEAVYIDAPAAGNLYVLLLGYTSFSGVTLTTFTPSVRPATTNTASAPLQILLNN